MCRNKESKMADFDRYPTDGSFLEKIHHVVIVLPIAHVVIPIIICGFILEGAVRNFIKNKHRTYIKKRNKYNIPTSYYIDD